MRGGGSIVLNHRTTHAMCSGAGLTEQSRDTHNTEVGTERKNEV